MGRGGVAVPSSSDLQERVDAVGSSVSKLLTLLHSALDRCLSFTYGYCLPQLLDAFQVCSDGVGECRL